MYADILTLNYEKYYYYNSLQKNIVLSPVGPWCKFL